MIDESLRALGPVLVTGAAGRIGRAVVNRLQDADVTVVGLDRRDPGDVDLVRFVVGDHTDLDTVARAAAPVEGVPIGAVVHLSAIPHPKLAEPEPLFRNNVVGTFAVLDAVLRGGARRAVIASSVQASGTINPASDPPAYFPIDEDLPICLSDAYALSKLVDEHTAAMLARLYGATLVAFRFPYTQEAEGIARTAARVRAHPEESMREGWAYLDVRDAAEAVAAALVAPLSGAHVLYVAAGNNIVGAPAAELAARYAPQIPLKAELVGDQSLISSERARQLLGWSAHHLLRAEPTHA